MNGAVPAPLAVVHAGALVLLGLGLLLAGVRLLRGPSTPDRTVALDMAGTLTLGVIAVHALVTGEAHLLQPAMVLALLAFLGTVTVARFLQRKGESESEGPR